MAYNILKGEKRKFPLTPISQATGSSLGGNYSMNTCTLVCSVGEMSSGSSHGAILDWNQSGAPSSHPNRGQASTVVGFFVRVQIATHILTLFPLFTQRCCTNILFFCKLPFSPST